MSSGTMTNRIDRMVAHGLVVRAGGANDRRVVLVRLTVEGKERVHAAMADLLDSGRRLLAVLPPRDRTILMDLLRTLLLPFES